MVCNRPTRIYLWKTDVNRVVVVVVVCEKVSSKEQTIANDTKIYPLLIYNFLLTFLKRTSKGTH